MRRAVPKPFHPGVVVHGLLVGSQGAGIALAIATIKLGVLALLGGAAVFAAAETLLLLSSW